MAIKRPPMGWNSWNTFGENINEQLIRDSADALVRTGLRDAGYEYVVIDDCWALRERVNGRITPDPAKFPSGMKALADYVHGKGLKFGMYSCAGTMTCAGYPASLDHEFIDAETFASWDVDYLKFDYCYMPENRYGYLNYRRMGLALANCGREIVLSACNWGVDKSPEWIKTTGASLWRSTGDIFDTWNSIKSLIQQQIPLLPYQGAGCWNDMDMLVVGMNGKGNVGLGGCTDVEYRTHFKAWCVLQSPLMIGCDLRSVDQKTLSLLKTPALIEIAQDEDGRQPYMLNSPDAPVFVRHLAGGDLAIGLFNLTDGDARYNCPLDNFALPASTGMTLELINAETGERTRPVNDTLAITLPAHDSVVYRAKVVRAK